MGPFFKISAVKGVLVLAAVFFSGGIAQAHPGHHSHPHPGHHSHHQHKAEIISPFNKVSADNPLHCLLNAHMHKAKQDCPYKGKNSNGIAKFRADCGSSPVNSVGFSSGSDLPQLVQSDEYSHHRSFASLIPQTVDKTCRFPHTIERPPQLL